MHQVSRAAVGPKEAPSQCLRYPPFPAVTWPPREVDYSPPSSSEVKNVWSYTSTISYALMALTGIPLPYNSSFAYIELHNTCQIPILHIIRI
jgi:hypothetical protein